MVTLLLGSSYVGALPTLDEVAGQESVYHEVWVATYRGGEVGIALEA